MGGYGSSRWGWHTKKRTTEQCAALDVSKLRRPGYLEPNNTVSLGVITWASGSRIGFTLRTEATTGELWPHYSVNGQAAPRYVMHLVTTRPRFGGLRWWWLCPWCHRRARILYLSPRNGRFECRLCAGLTYRSAQEHNKTLDRYMHLPTEALMATFRGGGHGAMHAAAAVMERHTRMLERVGRWAGVLTDGRGKIGDSGEV